MYRSVAPQVPCRCFFAPLLLSTMSSSDRRPSGEQAPLYPPPPVQWEHHQAAPTNYYGTFQGNPGYPQPPPPGFPQPVHPSQIPRHGYQPVPGYPVVEGMPVDRRHDRLPCCGIGIGLFLFIIGFFLAAIPWFVGAFILICLKHDYRERVGLICCTIAAILSLLATLVGTKSAHVW